MNHLKLGSFPNRSDPFFETLLAELREIIDPPAQVDNNAIVPALTTNSTSSLVEITTSCKRNECPLMVVGAMLTP